MTFAVNWLPVVALLLVGGCVYAYARYGAHWKKSSPVQQTSGSGKETGNSGKESAPRADYVLPRRDNPDAGERRDDVKKDDKETAREIETYPDSYFPNLVASIKEMWSRAEFAEATNELRRVKRDWLRFEADRTELDRLAASAKSYATLLGNTASKSVLPPPRITRITLDDDTVLLVKNHSLDHDREVYTDFHGKTGSTPRSKVVSVRILDTGPAAQVLRDALKSFAKSKGVEIADSPTEMRAVAGRRPSAEDYLALADFCAGNGIREPIQTLFDEALKVDPSLPEKPRDSKE